MIKATIYHEETEMTFNHNFPTTNIKTIHNACLKHFGKHISENTLYNNKVHWQFQKAEVVLENAKQYYGYRSEK
jgi:hypothetical protein